VIPVNPAPSESDLIPQPGRRWWQWRLFEEMSGLGSCPVPTGRDRNCSSPARLCKSDIGNAKATGDLRDRRLPNELVEILACHVMRPAVDLSFVGNSQTLSNRRLVNQTAAGGVAGVTGANFNNVSPWAVSARSRC
jgi:hypothetical protein